VDDGKGGRADKRCRGAGAAHDRERRDYEWNDRSPTDRRGDDRLRHRASDTLEPCRRPAHARDQTPAATLERIAGTDRFTLARHFRRAFGTSPDRYRTMRRVALARTAIEGGVPLARAAAMAGFADQSHMTRQFKRAYGLTPARWMALQVA
jgi:AraC-like DNA-binding protein